MSIEFRNKIREIRIFLLTVSKTSYIIIQKGDDKNEF